MQEILIYIGLGLIFGSPVLWLTGQFLVSLGKAICLLDKHERDRG